MVFSTYPCKIPENVHDPVLVVRLADWETERKCMGVVGTLIPSRYKSVGYNKKN